MDYRRTAIALPVIVNAYSATMLTNANNIAAGQIGVAHYRSSKTHCFKVASEYVPEISSWIRLKRHGWQADKEGIAHMPWRLICGGPAKAGRLLTATSSIRPNQREQLNRPTRHGPSRRGTTKSGSDKT